MSHDLISSSVVLDSFPTSVSLVRDVAGDYRQVAASELLQAAQQLLLSRVRGTNVLTSPQAVRSYLQLRLSSLGHEIFAVVHLDAQHCVIDYVEMFRGTLTQTSVYPREVVKESLARDTAAVVLVHNHPSGNATPSPADVQLTSTLKDALQLIDVRVLDHFIVGGHEIYSMAEHGLI